MSTTQVTYVDPQRKGSGSGGSVVKNLPISAGDTGSITWSRKIPCCRNQLAVCAPAPEERTCWDHVLWTPCSEPREATATSNPRKRGPCSPQLEKRPSQQGSLVQPRPNKYTHNSSKGKGSPTDSLMLSSLLDCLVARHLLSYGRYLTPSTFTNLVALTFLNASSR